MPNKAFDMCKAIPWAITEEGLRLIMAIANREIFVVQPVPSETPTVPIEAVELETGSRLVGTQNVRLRGSVAIVPIYGPIVRHASFFSDFSGATSIEMIAKDLNTALNSEEVTDILFDVDSPGGEVNGMVELSNIIYDAKKKKRMWAYTGNQMCSAAYCIGSAVDKIVASPTALVGSIGVMAALPDPNADDSHEVIFVSSQSPRKNADITTKEGRSQVQTTIDNLAEVFIATVARNRGVPVSTVEDNYGQGAVFVGKYAIEAGLVDELGSLEGAIASLAESATSDSEEKLAAIRAQEEELGLKEDIMKILNGESESEQPVSSNPTPPVEPTPVPAVVPTTPVVPTTAAIESDEYKALQAENRRLRMTSYNSEAARIIDLAISAGQAFPSERATLVQMYVQAAFDDQTFGSIDPSGASRVSIFEANIAARPKNQLTEETIRPELLKIIRQPESTVTDKNAPADDETVAKLVSMTNIGAVALEAAKNGGSK